MAESEQPVTDNKPDEAQSWYNERRTSALREVESRLNELSSGYEALNQTWSALDEKEDSAHQSLDTRALVNIVSERQRLQNEAAQIQQGWAALQSEKQRLEQNPDPKFDELLNGSSQAAQMFLRSYKHKLNDPATLKKLMFSDARAKASGLTPDSPTYFKALQVALGLEDGERSLDDFKGEFDERTNTLKVDNAPRSKPKETQATEAQRVMAKNLPGISEQDYLANIAQPFSQASQTVSLEPDELSFGQTSKGLEVNLDETPKQAPVKYKTPNPKTSVNLSPAELSLIENMAVATNRPLAEVRKEFATQKLALYSGKTSHMLYQDRLKAMGQA